MVQNTAYSTTCFYLNWQMYSLSNYNDCVFVLVLFYQKKFSSSNNANQKPSWLYRFFFGLPLSLYIMKALMMTTLMRKCSRYFHSVCLCCTMIVIDKKVTLPKMGLLICNWLGSANDPIDPVLSFLWQGHFPAATRSLWLTQSQVLYPSRQSPSNHICKYIF